MIDLYEQMRNYIIEWERVRKKIQLVVSVKQTRGFVETPSTECSETLAEAVR